MGVPYLCWRRRRWWASMFLMWFLGMRRLTSFQIFFERSSALRMTRFGLGCVEGPPSQDKRLGFAISWPGFPGVSRSMSFWPWNWKYKARLFLKFPGLFLKFPGLFPNFPGLFLKFPGLNSKVSRNKGLASAPERKGQTWTVGRFKGPRSWGPSLSCLIFWNRPCNKPQLLSCSDASGLNRICS